jgi:hypothetical protein
MCPTRRGSALITAAAIAMLLAACTSGTGQSSNGKTGPAATSGHTPARTNGLSTSSATPAAESMLDCGGFIDNNARAAPLPVVLGVVALPASPGYPALGTSLSGDGNGPLRLFAKTGLVIRPGTTFELIVPAPFTSRLSIGWGSPDMPSHRVLVDNCADTGGGWLAYAGGYWIDHPACVPIIVRAGGKQQLVHIGVGTACPGQRPPQGPSQS